MNKKEVEQIARQFHDTYERLAPEYGYETRKDTKEFNPNSKNGKLMIRVCNEVVTKATEPLVFVMENIKHYHDTDIRPTQKAMQMISDALKLHKERMGE